MAKIKVKRYNFSDRALEKAKKNPFLEMLIKEVGITEEDLKPSEDIYIDTDKVLAVGDIYRIGNGREVFNIYFTPIDGPNTRLWMLCGECYDKFMKAWLGN